MSCKKIILIAWIISFLSFSVFSVVEAVRGNSESVKLSEGIKVAGEITIKDSPLTLADVMAESSPDFSAPGEKAELRRILTVVEHSFSEQSTWFLAIF